MCIYIYVCRYLYIYIYILRRSNSRSWPIASTFKCEIEVNNLCYSSAGCIYIYIYIYIYKPESEIGADSLNHQIRDRS